MYYWIIFGITLVEYFGLGKNNYVSHSLFCSRTTYLFSEGSIQNSIQRGIKMKTKICSKCKKPIPLTKYRTTSTIIRGKKYVYPRADCNSCHNKKIYTTPSYIDGHPWLTKK
jgi:hypothetical protein